MIENQIGKRYAEALSEAIADESRLGGALESMRELARAFQEDPSLGRFFIHPSIPDANKAALAGELCDRVGACDEVRKLLLLLVERKKMGFLKNIAAHFDEVVMKRLNQVRVRVEAASPLSDDQVSRLKESLDRILKQSALIEVSVDESLIGGVRLSIGSLVADSSIKNKLALLKRAIEQEEVLSELAS